MPDREHLRKALLQVIAFCRVPSLHGNLHPHGVRLLIARAVGIIHFSPSCLLVSAGCGLGPGLPDVDASGPGRPKTPFYQAKPSYLWHKLARRNVFRSPGHPHNPVPAPHQTPRRAHLQPVCRCFRVAIEPGDGLTGRVEDGDHALYPFRSGVRPSARENAAR